MSKIDNNIVGEILKNIGGKNNVVVATNCMTRLRLTLKDNTLVETTTLKKIDNVMGVVNSDDQLQIILGPGKAQTAAELMNVMLNDKNSSADDDTTEGDLATVAAKKKQQMKSSQQSSFHQFLSKFATIFTPLIPGFIAAGLLLGFATLMEQTIADRGALLNDLIIFMKVFSKGLFSFLGILIGFNAQKAFGGSGVNGAIIASLFVMGYVPAEANKVFSGMTDFFGHTIDPRGNIIGILLACIFGAYVERWVRKFIPDNLDMILTSGITLLIVAAVTFIVIMPIGVYLFNGMSWLFLHLNKNPLGAAVLAGLFLIAVVFGIHQGFVPVYIALMDAQGFNSLFPILAMAGGGQVGAALALYAKSAKDSLLRKQIKGSIIPGFLGIGEPLIYGVTLPRLKPFVTACIGGAIGGLFIGCVAYAGYPIGLNSVFGPSGLVAIPLMTSNSGVMLAMGVYTAGVLISYAAGFILTYFFGTKDVDLD